MCALVTGVQTCALPICMRTSLRHARCFFMKVGRIEAHRSGERLAMGETAAFPHQRVAVAGGHLDMIAKHGIMTDLERSDARLRPIFRLQRGNGAPPIPRHSPATVECCVLAISDKIGNASWRERGCQYVEI